MSIILSAAAAVILVPLTFGASAQSNLIQYSEYTMEFSFGDSPETQSLILDLRPGMRYTVASGEIRLSDEDT